MKNVALHGVWKENLLDYERRFVGLWDVDVRRVLHNWSFRLGTFVFGLNAPTLYGLSDWIVGFYFWLRLAGDGIHGRLE